MRTKTILSLFILLATHIASAQSEKAYVKIRAEVCNCLSQLPAQGSSITEAKNCVRTAMRNNITEVLQPISAQHYPDSIARMKGMELGASIGMRLDTDLIYHCDTYFNMVDHNRRHEFDAYNRDSLKTRLMAMADSTRDFKYHLERSYIYLILEDYVQAGQEADEALKLEPQSPTSQLFKACYLESAGRYREAARLYYAVAESLGERSYLVWAAIANRKEKERGGR